MVLLLLCYVVLGMVTGMLAGLFGIGGGTILVPVLLLSLHWQGVPAALHAHMAIGSSLACIVLSSAMSTWQHHRHAAVQWPLVWRLAPGVCVGVWAGAALAARVPGAQLVWWFGVFCWVMAAQMASGWQPAGVRGVPGRTGLVTAGGVIGMVSAFFGIGGGSLTVPFLAACRVRMQTAVATAAACGFPLALVGAAGYAWQGLHTAGLPAWSLGYVYLPALVGVGMGSLLTTPVGVRLAHRWSPLMLKRVFAVFLVCVGAGLMWR